MSRFEETRIRGHFTGEETEAVEMGRHLSRRGSGRVRMRRRTCSPRRFFFFLLIVSKYFPVALVPGAVQGGMMLRGMKNWLCPPGTCSGMGTSVL